VPVPRIARPRLAGREGRSQMALNALLLLILTFIAAASVRAVSRSTRRRPR